MEPLVSVIMPVYNAKKYVGKAIESVLRQTYKNIELVLVIDGSTDGSDVICEKYAAQDPRVIIIHQRNAGICNARNKGISISKGKYIAFCDHDDLMKRHCIANAVDEAEKMDSNLVKYPYYRKSHRKNGNVRIGTQKMPSGVIPLQNVIHDYDLFNLSVLAVWNGLYRKEIIDRYNICFDESFQYGLEDRMFNLSILPHIDRIDYISKPAYIHYVRSKQSTDEQYHEEKFNDMLRVKRKEFFFLREMDNGGNLAGHQSFFLLYYLRMITRPSNPMTFFEKRRKLKKLRTEGNIKVKGGVKNGLKLMCKQPKSGVVVLMFNFHLYGLLILIYSFYSRYVWE